MTLSENIAKYRKQMGYTQDKLGELLGVTNQAVSKWELGISMPDVMLLPKIADVLGTTLNGLYGIEDKSEPTNQGLVTADEFPKAANDMLIEYFKKQSCEDFHTSELEDPWVLLCTSNDCGTAYISQSLSFITNKYKVPGSEGIFGEDQIAYCMKLLSDRKIRKVLTYMYQASFHEKHTYCRGFFVSEICETCDLEVDTALEILSKIRSFNLLEIVRENDGNTEYIFIKSRGQYLLLAFQAIELLLQETQSFEVIRESSLITDHAFEKLWK